MDRWAHLLGMLLNLALILSGFAGGALFALLFLKANHNKRDAANKLVDSLKNKLK